MKLVKTKFYYFSLPGVARSFSKRPLLSCTQFTCGIYAEFFSNKKSKERGRRDLFLFDSTNTDLLFARSYECELIIHLLGSGHHLSTRSHTKTTRDKNFHSDFLSVFLKGTNYTFFLLKFVCNCTPSEYNYVYDSITVLNRSNFAQILHVAS